MTTSNGTRDGLTASSPSPPKHLKAATADELVKQLDVARTELAGVISTISATRSKVDDAFYKSLDETTRKSVDTAAAKPRNELARSILESPVREVPKETPENPPKTTQEGPVIDPTLLDLLGERYNLRYYHFARDVSQISDPLADDGEEATVAIGKNPPTPRRISPERSNMSSTTPRPSPSPECFSSATVATTAPVSPRTVCASSLCATPR